MASAFGDSATGNAPPTATSPEYTVKYTFENGERVRVGSDKPNAFNYADCFRLVKRAADTIAICTLGSCRKEYKVSFSGRIMMNSACDHMRAAHYSELTLVDRERVNSAASATAGTKRRHEGGAAGGAAGAGEAEADDAALADDMAKLCVEGPLAFTYASGNEAFMRFLRRRGALKPGETLPSARTLSRRADEMFEQWTADTSRTFAAFRNTREIKVEGQPLTIRHGFSVMLDAWKRKQTNDHHLAIALQYMEESTVTTASGGTFRTVRSWRPKATPIGFAKFNPARANAEAYAEATAQALTRVGLSWEAINFGCTDTTNVCPAIFDLPAAKHAKWNPCKQHVGDRSSEDVHDMPELRSLYWPSHNVAFFFMSDGKKMDVLHQEQDRIAADPALPAPVREQAAKRAGFVLPVVTRYATRVLEMKQVVKQWPILERIPPAVFPVGSDDRLQWARLHAEYDQKAEAASAAVELWRPILEHSPSFGRERDYTIGLTQVGMRSNSLYCHAGHFS